MEKKNLHTLSLLVAVGGLTGVLLLACSDQGAHQKQAADAKHYCWQLLSPASKLEFTSVKKGNFAETHQINTLNGQVDSQGHAEIRLSLDSVETGIDVRNQRMRTYLFETSQWPVATITAQLNPSDFTQLDTDRPVVKDVNMHVSLHGKTQAYTVPVTVIKTGPEKIRVLNENPVVVHADDFALQDGLNTLAELAKLPPIKTEVPVRFKLEFTPVEGDCP